MKKEKKQKQPKKKRTLFGILSKFFLILAILFFLLAVAGISDGVISVFIFCLLCGLVCLYVCRLLKKNDKINEQIAAQDAAEAAAQVAAEAAAQVAAAQAVAAKEERVEVVYPDGHTETHNLFREFDADEGCLIVEGGKTYHNKVKCFRKWSAEYRETFKGWQLITLEDAENRGLRRCKFCYGYELAKEDSRSFVCTLSCAAQKYQDNMFWCEVGEKCSIEYDYDKARYNVLCGYEIGYLSDKVVEKYSGNIEYADVFIDEITEGDNGKYKVKLLIR